MITFQTNDFLIIGHRGAKGHVLENSVASFHKAIELGVNAVELDVYQCKSGELVVFHDYNLRRMGSKGEIEKMTYTELCNQHLKEELVIPTLKEIIAICYGKALMNIEIKGKTVVEPLLLLIEELKNEFPMLNQSILVSSFHWVELEKLRDLSGELALGVLVYNPWYFRKALKFAEHINALSIHPRFDLCTRKRILKMKKQRLKIFPWTVNHFADLEDILSKNVNGIISDYPDRLALVYKQSQMMIS